MFAHFNDLSHTSMTDADGTVPESGTFVCRIPKLPLVPGLYSLESVISTSRRNGSSVRPSSGIAGVVESRKSGTP